MQKESIATQRKSSFYLESASHTDYLRELSSVYPALAAILDFRRTGADAALEALAGVVTEFDSDDNGRGDSYRRAQQDAAVRLTGIKRLIRLVAPEASRDHATILDILGGDGTLARAVAGSGSTGLASKLTLFTSDISAEMIEQALAYGLPAIRQAATFLFLKDESVDGALLAYGTHHIAPADRLRAVTEAVRVVRPGGNIVLHDFAESSPMARFFAEVVHRFSVAGHDYPHFCRDALVDLFDDAGTPAGILDVYDPLIVAADSPEIVRRLMCDYLADMYGVRKFFDGQPDEATAWEYICDIFDHAEYLASVSPAPSHRVRPEIYRSADQYVAEIPRYALVAVAEKKV